MAILKTCQIRNSCFAILKSGEQVDFKNVRLVEWHLKMNWFLISRSVSRVTMFENHRKCLILAKISFYLQICWIFSVKMQGEYRISLRRSELVRMILLGWFSSIVMCNIKYKCRIPQLLGRLVGYSIKKLHTSLAKGKSPFFFPSSLTKIAFFLSKKRC